MPEMLAIGQFERRLAELGCPEALAHRKARELAEHHADLKEAALEDGLSETEAEARAVAQLGETTELAETLVGVMRRSSWWGRHPVIGFCLLPPIGFAPFWALSGAALMGITWLLGHLFGPAYLVNGETIHSFTLAPGEFEHYVNLWNNIVSVCATAMMTGLFFWMVRRSVAGWKWMLISCAACSASMMFTHATVSPNSINLGYFSGTENWLCVAVPWLIMTAAVAWDRRRLRRLPAASTIRAAKRRESVFHGVQVKNILLTPTYWFALAGIAGVVFVAGLIRTEILREENLRNHVWPAERAVTLARVNAAQSSSDAVEGITIDLQPYANASLTATTDESADTRDNNLAELPTGVHTFGGVPFDVRGKIQLMGRSELSANRAFPTGQKGIKISRKCASLDLLHGASGLLASDGTIARLVLHYADGSTQKLEIVAGEQVQNWRGPTYTTRAEDEPFAPRAAGSELAWVGRNSWVKNEAPEASVRLYKSTFANPQPDVEISSVDYVSTLKQAAPFLVGLTLEESK